jgi:Uma2 family endonuclease
MATVLAPVSTPTVELTLADLLARLGNLPLSRIRKEPRPGTATAQDVIALHDHHHTLCELVDGVLLEKTVGYNESGLAVFLASLVNAFVIGRNLGLVTGPDGMIQLASGLVRIPDVSFTSWARIPGGRRPNVAVPSLVPNLAVEILSQSNTASEMEAKRRDYFSAGVDLVWQVDPNTRTVAVYTANDCTMLSESDVLDGGSVLPGFTLPLSELFAELDRQAPPA